MGYCTTMLRTEDDKAKTLEQLLKGRWVYKVQPQHFQEGHLQFAGIWCSAAQDGSGAAWSVRREDEGAVEARRVLGGRSVPQNATPSLVVFQKIKLQVYKLFTRSVRSSDVPRRLCTLQRGLRSYSQHPESQCGRSKHHTHILPFLSAGWEILPKDRSRMCTKAEKYKYFSQNLIVKWKWEDLHKDQQTDFTAY